MLRLLLLAAVFCVGAPRVALAWCQSCSIEQAPLSCAQPCFCPVDTNPAAHLLFWNRACIEISVEDDPGESFSTAQLDAAVDRSFARWTDADCGGRTPGFQIRRTEDRARCDVSEYVSGEGNANSIAIVQDGWEERIGHDRAAFALTTTFFLLNTGEIIDADMEINDDNWRFADCPEDGCEDGGVDLENTITHEAGHFFGVAHADSDPEATMWACADAGDVNKRSLEADDIEAICTIYGPDALPASCDFTPRGGFDPFCEDDRKCGCRTPGSGGNEGALPFALLLAAIVVRRRRGARA